MCFNHTQARDLNADFCSSMFRCYRFTERTRDFFSNAPFFGPSAAVIGFVRCDDLAVPLVMNIKCCEEIFPSIILISNPTCIHFRFTKVTVIRLLIFQM
ncbi:hypothetical protein KUCAC02_011159 [Chaenocephalus aceratus]|uniref:Uncharacterized protein n=1 Tax=Chaenocephalus aceratus TaxID=36190 RepID=A0ACB9WVN4_CHAAC|nr:hypothetical protein KUCAC02_011159 [Chaenocephalus aceratus]